MNKNTIFYGFLAVGSIFAYYAWKQHILSSKETSERETTPLSHTSGIFVDDVPVNPKVLGFNEEPKTFVENVKNTVSKIIEPIIGTVKQNKLTGQGQFLES